MSNKIITLSNRKIEGIKTAYISLDTGLFPNTLSRDKRYKIIIYEEEKEENKRDPNLPKWL